MRYVQLFIAAYTQDHRKSKHQRYGTAALQSRLFVTEATVKMMVSNLTALEARIDPERHSSQSGRRVEKACIIKKTPECDKLHRSSSVDGETNRL